MASGPQQLGKLSGAVWTDEAFGRGCGCGAFPSGLLVFSGRSHLGSQVDYWSTWSLVAWPEGEPKSAAEALCLPGCPISEQAPLRPAFR